MHDNSRPCHIHKSHGSISATFNNCQMTGLLHSAFSKSFDRVSITCSSFSYNSTAENTNSNTNNNLASTSAGYVMPMDAGEIITGETVFFCIYDQMGLQDNDENRRVLDYVKNFKVYVFKNIEKIYSTASFST